MMEQEQMEQMMEQEHWSSETRCPGTRGHSTLSCRLSWQS